MSSFEAKPSSPWIHSTSERPEQSPHPRGVMASDRVLSKASTEVEAAGSGVLPETPSKSLALFFVIRGEMFRESAYDAVVTTGPTEITKRKSSAAAGTKRALARKFMFTCSEG